jgi:Spy/CpxP family protein refolding chaperone
MQKETFMKHFATRILTLLCAASAAAMAQPPIPQIAASYGPVVVIPWFIPPALDQTNPAAYWADSLGLDASQQASVKVILADQQSSTNALKTNLDQARSALLAAAKANSADAEINRLSADLGAVYAQAVAVQAKAYARFQALLTPDQRQRFDKLSELPAGGGIFGSAGAPGAAVKQ